MKERNRIGLPLEILMRFGLIPLIVLSSFRVRADTTSEPEAFACLKKSYPTHIHDLRLNPHNNKFEVLMGEGSVIPWDDGVKNKSFEDRLNSPDVQDMLSIPYPLGELLKAPAVNEDPGRIRVASFFGAIYGRSPAEVKRNLTEVIWMPRFSGLKLRFNRVNGAAQALANVSAELERLPAPLLKYVIQVSGTFRWRTIHGTQRLSAHSYGVAIDINTTFTDYWRWHKSTLNAPVYRNRIPREIVALFEKHGFIWGGKWYHYDTMHFEYRPELILHKCATVTNTSGTADPAQ